MRFGAVFFFAWLFGVQALAGDTRASNELSDLALDVNRYRRAACLAKTGATARAVDRHSKRFVSEKVELASAVINGASLENENPRLIEVFRALTTHEGYCPSSSRLGCQRTVTLKPGCVKVACALEGLFGKTEAKRLVYLYDNYGLNGSSLAFSPSYPGEEFKNWTSVELDQALIALAEMPAVLRSGIENRPFVRRNTLRDELPLVSSTGFVLADERLSFNDLWAMQPSELKRSEILHEMAHVLDTRVGISKTPLWQSFSGLVSRYAAESPKEDFAESVTAYRYDPRGLLEASSEKYFFLKTVVFDGREYLYGGKCKNEKPLSANWDERLRERLLNYSVR